MVTFTLTIACPRGREVEVGHAVKALVAGLKAAPLSPQDHARALGLVGWEDPRSDDPARFLDTLLRRLTVDDDTLTAWTTPAPPPLDPEGLRAFAEGFLTDLIDLSDL